MAAEQLFWDSPEAIEYMAKILRSGQIILGTSDTILGLLGFLSETAAMKLNEIKKRVEKPYIILIKDIGRLPLFVKMPIHDKLALLMHECWPGPLTLVMKANPDLPSHVQSPQGTVALRIPDHAGLLSLLDCFPGLFSTSANKAGSPTPQTLGAIDAEILTMVACIVTDRNYQAKSSPSTILDCTGEKPRVLREGSFSIHQLEQIYGERFER